MDRVNHSAALASALAYYLLGWLWYGVLFTDARGSAVSGPDPVPFIVAAAMSLVLAYVTAILLNVTGWRSAAQGALFGLLMGVGLVASAMLEYYLYEAGPVRMWLINAGYIAIGLTMIGAIVGGWQQNKV